MKIDLSNSRYIDINRWYCCLVDNHEELLKVTRHCIEVNSNNTKVFCYRVDCYYYGKSLFVGTLKECREWLYQRMTTGTLKDLRKEFSHYGKA